MKKLFIILICFIAVTGCTKEESINNEVQTYSLKYNDDYYTIYLPYKKGVGNNYILNSNVVDFNVDNIERGLVQISANEFDVNKYYYQEGQYLKESDLKTLLSKDSLNKISEKTIDGKKIKPTLIAGIFEKNFLNKSGELKGISLGVVLNPYQSYDSNNNYVKYNQDDLVNFGKERSKELVKYLQNEKKINVPILVALYIEASPNSNVGGNYLYYGVSDKDNIEFHYINQKSYYMNNGNVKNMDSTNFNNFKKYEELIRNYDNSIYVSGLGSFNGDKLNKLDIVVTKTNYSYGELLYISQLLSENTINYFKDIKVVIEIKAFNEVKAYIVKEPGETSTNIFIY